jgi:hypothetical protein
LFALFAIMVFTNAQTTAFFEDPLQMGIPNATCLQLVTEGIVSVDDLEEFDEANMKQITDNLRRPSGRVPVDPAVPNGPTVATHASIQNWSQEHHPLEGRL